MISANITSKAFGEQTILQDISLTVASGETLAILGPSGIGKSTLLSMIAGTDTAFDGTVTRPTPAAIVFQEPTLLPWRSALQNIMLLHPNLSSAEAVQALARVGIADKSDLFPGQLSLGQQRRLALARAFATPPKMLLMDEPFVSLDDVTADEMLTLTETLIAEARPATIFVTHNRAEAKRLATKTLTLSGTPATLTGGL